MENDNKNKKQTIMIIITVSMVIIKPIMTIIIIYVLTRCRRAIGEDVNK